MRNLLKQDFLSPAEVEQKYGILESTLNQWRYKGKGPAYFKLGRKVRYAVSEIEEWVMKRLVLTSDSREKSPRSR